MYNNNNSNYFNPNWRVSTFRSAMQGAAPQLQSQYSNITSSNPYGQYSSKDLDKYSIKALDRFRQQQDVNLQNEMSIYSQSAQKEMDTAVFNFAKRGIDVTSNALNAVSDTLNKSLQTIELSAKLKNTNDYGAALENEVQRSSQRFNETANNRVNLIRQLFSFASNIMG